VKQAIIFAGACAGIVLWHLPTTAACFARTVEGSYTCTEGGAVPAPMHSARTESVSGVPKMFRVERMFDTPTALNTSTTSTTSTDGAFDVREVFGPLGGPFTAPIGFASAHEPLVEPR